MWSAANKFTPFDISPWKRERVFFSGDKFFNELLAEIDAAKSSIEIESYIFDDDELSRRVTEALIKAHDRKIAVRCLVDGFGALNWTHHCGERLADAGVAAAVYHPLPWENFERANAISRSVPTLASALSRINKRNHRKVCIVDGKCALVGSFNISSRHVESISGDAAWRDTGILVEGEAVKYLRAAFERIWYPATPRYFMLRRSALKTIRESGGSAVRLNATRSIRRRSFRALLKLIENAKQRVWITNAYFVPTGSLLHAISAAAKRGVDVRIMTPSQSDVFFLPWVSAAFLVSLHDAGATIFNYKPRVLHAKTMLIDNLAMIGSSNLNHRSIIHDLEVDLFSENPNTVSALAKQFELDAESSVRSSRAMLDSIPLSHRLIARIALWFRNFL